MRLIDADNLLKALKAADIDTSDLVGKVRKSERLLCIQYINTEPTVEERPQGEWIFTDDDYGFWHCNQCKAIGSSHNNFCPNCGADMRGEEK